MEHTGKNITAPPQKTDKKKKFLYNCLDWLRRQVTSDKSTAHQLNYMTLKIAEPSI